MLQLTLHPELTLAFFQGTQLNLFERFLTQAVSGIDSTGITSGMQNVAYVVLLVGFLWQVYQSLLHGGDVRGLGTGLIKYVVTAIIVMNYGTVFTAINQGFVNGGNWVSNASGAGSLFENWKSDLQTQYSQAGFQQMWGLITGSIAGLIDGLLILVAWFNAAALMSGRRLHHSAIFPGQVRFNSASGFDPEFPRRAVGITFQCSGPRQFAGKMHLLFERRATGNVPDAHLVTLKSTEHGAIQFAKPGWKSAGVQPISISLRGEKYEAMLLFGNGDWVKSDLGRWQVDQAQCGISLDYANEGALR